MAFKKRRTLKRKRSTKRKSYSRKTSIKKIVKREIARNIENKCKQQFNFEKSLYPSAAVNFPDNVIELGPGALMLIAQGTGQGSRIGNTIKTKKLMFKGTVVPTPYNAGTNGNPRPVQLKMWIFYDKSDPTAVPQPGNDFFQDGGSSRGFSNDLTDLWSPINTDKYRVLASKSFKIGYSQYAGAAATPANQQAFQAYSNNDFKLNANFSFDLTKHYPQMVKFNDNSTTPTTRGLFCLFYYTGADGQQLPSTSVSLGVQYMQDYVYEDA